LINMITLKSSCHFFLPNPQCPVCGRLPVDSSTEARISLQPSLKISADSYRCRPMNDLKKVLIQDYLDYKTGIFNGEMQDLASPFADASVNLKHQALNPITVGVHAKEQYSRLGFPFKPFNPDRPIDWVWGYSFLQERPILIPELLAYYSLGCGHGYVYETSNGCALGGSLEEAIFYAIMEVVERDSFLLTWYARLPIPRIDLNSINDQEIRLMVERLQVVAGYDVLLFNSTMEHGIPSVWAIAKNRKRKGVNLICAAGAHLDPIRAARSAIHELVGMIKMLDQKFEENQEEYVRMLHDSSLVQRMSYDLASVCRKRSPGNDFVLGNVSQIQLATLLQEAMASFSYRNDLDGAHVENESRVNLYGCLYGVEGIPNGAYRYDSVSHALRLVRAVRRAN
jgi:ribosomal protein S12 methylthiotransferase accessory factor